MNSSLVDNPAKADLFCLMILSIALAAPKPADKTQLGAASPLDGLDSEILMPVSSLLGWLHLYRNAGLLRIAFPNDVRVMDSSLFAPLSGSRRITQASSRLCSAVAA